MAELSNISSADGWAATFRQDAAHTTDLGVLVVSDCLDVLRQVPDHTFDLIIT